MADTLADEMLNGLCRYWDYYVGMIGILGVILLLTVAGFAVLEPGSPTYVINLVNLMALSVFIVGIGALMVYCFRSGRAQK